MRYGPGLPDLQITGTGEGIPEARVKARGPSRRTFIRQACVTEPVRGWICLREQHVAKDIGFGVALSGAYLDRVHDRGDGNPSAFACF